MLLAAPLAIIQLKHKTISVYCTCIALGVVFLFRRQSAAILLRSRSSDKPQWAAQRESSCVKEEQSCSGPQALSHTHTHTHWAEGKHCELTIIINIFIFIIIIYVLHVSKRSHLMSQEEVMVPVQQSRDPQLLMRAESSWSISRWWGGRRFIERGADQAFASWQTLLEVPDIL